MVDTIHLFLPINYAAHAVEYQKVKTTINAIASFMSMQGSVHYHDHAVDIPVYLLMALFERYH